MSSSPSRAASRRPRQREIQPGQLTAAALELFLEHGFAGTRMEDVASRAGVSKGAIYLHFATKEELFRAVVRAGIVPRIDQAEAAISDFRGSARELLSSLLHGLLLEFWDSPSSGIPKLMVAEARQFPGLASDYFAEISLRARQLMERVLRRGIESGEFRRDLDVTYCARVISSALDQQAILQHSMAVHDPEPLVPERFVDALLDMAMHGMLDGPGSADGVR